MAKPSYIENWPSALYALSIAGQDVPLTLDEARALGSNNGEYGEAFGPPQDIGGIRQRVKDAVALFPKGAFVRLGSRSPKDSWEWYRSRPPGRIEAGDDPLRFLLDSSERVSDDLHLAIANHYAPHIWVRAWLDMPPEAEFRCFVRGRKLVGACQYDPRGVYPELTDSLYPWAISNFFRQVFRPAIHLDDVVFDVFVRVKRRGNDRDIEVILIEINPFGPFTDPILFDWRNSEDFDGTLRYRAEDGMKKVPL